MPYAPPSGISVTFNFLGAYSPPSGVSVVIDFALLPDPGGGSGHEQLPGVRALLKDYIYREEAWHPSPRRFFAVQDSIAGSINAPFTRPAMWTKYHEEPWFPPRRKIIGVPRTSLRGRRHAAQIIG